MKRSSIALFAMILVSGRAIGVIATAEDGAISITVYAPDWTWQKRDINVLIVIENKSPSEVSGELSLQLPDRFEDHFKFDGEASNSFALASGSEGRFAFTNITALDGVPRQTYAFAIELNADAGVVRVPFDITTVRGAAVSPGLWAIWLPAGVAACWCVVFLAMMGRYAQPRSWLTPSPPIAPVSKMEPWIERTP